MKVQVLVELTVDPVGDAKLPKDIEATAMGCVKNAITDFQWRLADEENAERVAANIKTTDVRLYHPIEVKSQRDSGDGR